MLRRTVRFARRSGLLLAAALFAFPAPASSFEPDLLEWILRRPLRIRQYAPFHWTLDRYGDLELTEAVDALGDLPPPRTVPGLGLLLAVELRNWDERLRSVRPGGPMWPGAMEQRDRLGYLAYLLAASRDPRAATILAAHVDNRWIGISVCSGLRRYFLSDARYRRVPLTEGSSMQAGNFIYEDRRLVKLWIQLNREKLGLP